MPQEETLHDGKYKEINYTIIQTNNEEVQNDFEHNPQFILLVDGERVIDEEDLEAYGYSEPWETALRKYAYAYIDGLKN